MRRVLVIGSGGAGKSTFARRLAERTGLPLIHLDERYWHEGWVATPNAEWDAVIAELVGQGSWIMDGNYGRTLPARLAACDTVIFLDVPRLVCLWRLVKRRLGFAGRTRPGVAPGCPERLTWEFAWWIWDYPRRRRPGVLAQLAAATHARSIVLSSTASMERFLAGLGGVES